MSNSGKEILFEKFEIIDCLKKDDYSAVYLADHIYLSKKIILKSLNTKVIADNSVIERFKREAKILAQLDHPNIIKVLDFGTFDKFFYISFEYFPGANLRTQIKDNSWSNEQKKHLTSQLLTGIEFAHRNNVIHRDIKPENIFVDGDLNLKIGDFGLAFSAGDANVTSKSAVVGTPMYMSPEQIQGDIVTTRSDLFSTGVVLLELFTGVNLFAAEDINGTINKIINFNFEQVNELINPLDKELQELISGLLRKKPPERLTSAASALSIIGENVKLFGTDQSEKKSVAKNVAAFIFFAALVTLGTIFIYPMFTIHKSDIQQRNLVADSVKNISADENTETNLDTPDKSMPESKIENDNSTLGEVVPSVPSEQGRQIEIGGNQNEKVETKTFGSLQIECFPWANVYLDSVFVDLTPIEDEIVLPAGEHIVQFENPGYPVLKEKVNIPVNEKFFLNVNLDTLMAYVKINVYPWGEILNGDVLLGRTPMPEPVKIFPGKHIFRIKNPDYKTLSREIFFRKNDTLNINYNFITSKFEMN